MRRWCYIGWLVFCLSGIKTAVLANETTLQDSLPAEVRYDSTTMSVRQLDQARLNQLASDPDFQYDEKQLDLTWWQRFKQWLRYQILQLMSREGSVSMLKVILVVLGIVALVYLILKLFGMDVAHIFSRKGKTAALNATEHSEDIHALDFHAELRRAIEAGNYRLAVRLLYLHSLKQLSDLELIDWQPAKTNTHYVDELRNTAIQPTFRQLTRQFEYIWYGDFEVDHQRFNHLENAFNQFEQELK